MSAYENGCSTRKTILDTCFRLFLEKGFHETSYEDICREAHVNRGSIYYHFKEKDNIRYEVQWELMIRNRAYVESCCPGTPHGFTLALYLLWVLYLEDPHVRKFFLEYYHDQPTYSPNSELGRFFYIATEQMYSKLLHVEKIDHFSMAAVYGHIHAVLHLASETPEQYDAKAMERHCVYVGTSIWGIPKETIDPLWAEVETEMAQIPLDEFLQCWFESGFNVSRVERGVHP